MGFSGVHEWVLKILKFIGEVRMKFSRLAKDRGYLYCLAETPADIYSYFGDNYSGGFVGMDTETTGLNTLKNQLVGLSFSVKAKTGIYIPLNHKVGDNLRSSVVASVLKELFKKCRCFVL